MILVTGGTGLVGGHLLWHLLQTNNKVIAIRRTTSNLKPLHSIFSFYSSQADEFLSRIEWRFADVLDCRSLEEAMQGVNVVYHCAAMVSLGKVENNLQNINVTGTKNVVQAIRTCNVKKLCFVSSIAACGKANNANEIDEDAQWNDQSERSQYAKSKYLSEQEIWKGIAQGLDAIIVNPGVILGFSATNSGSAQLFSQVKKGLIFYTNGGSGYVDVKDVVRIMIQLTNSEIKNERFILVAENCSNKTILNLMADGFNKHRPFILIGKKTLMFIASLFELLGKLFNFQPFIDTSTARSASNRAYYSNKKIKDTLGISFQPISKCIKEVCELMILK